MYPLAILIGGPTAAKKTELAFEIQSKIPSVIINSDSMQVYSDLRSLTNIPSKHEMTQHSCNLFEFINYPTKCDVGHWLNCVKRVLSDTKNKIPIFVGGTGLYLESLQKTISPIPRIPLAVTNKIQLLHNKYGNRYFYKKLQGFDIEYSKKISENDTQRLFRAICVKIVTGKNLSYWHSIKSKKIFRRIFYVTISNDRDELYKSINQRCLKILKSTAIQEVHEFLKKRQPINHPLHKSIGFKIIEDYINNKRSFEDSLEVFKQETRRYAKRQITWFKNRAKDSKKMKFEEAKKYLLKNI